MTTGKVAVALGAGALLPRARPPDAGEKGMTKNDDDNEQPAGGLATAAITWAGNSKASHLIDVGLVPIQFVIAPTTSEAG